MIPIDAVHLTITTACNRACPECCCGIGRRPVVNYGWPYFEAAAEWLYGIDRIRITGGVPLVHPQFDNFAARWKALFDCRVLELETNADLQAQHTDALGHFDLIIASRYGDNESDVKALVKRFGAKTSLDIDQHIPRSRRGNGSECFRSEIGIAAYSDGRFYGCCVAPGIDGAESLKPCPDWRTKVQVLALPCADCMFS